MNRLLTVLYTEGLKIWKSRVVWLTAAAFTIAPFMAGFFMFVIKNPELAERAGLLGAKAQIAGEASWPSYFNLHAQMVAVGGILIFGFVTSWVFGREHSDRTVKDLLALPCSRSAIIMAKFIAVFMTNLLICAYIVTLGILIGKIIGLPQWSFDIVIHGLYVLLITTILTIALCTPVAFFASFGKGYLAPLGFVILMLVLSQIAAVAGFGEYFPWAIPALYSGVTVEEGSTLDWSSIGIILITSLLGILATLFWWLFADHH